ncbi:MAG: hypothetical protein ACPG5B_10540 [Chitinophagales bacterium]
MKNYLALVFIFFFTIPLFAQVDTTKVAFVAYWSVGDSYDFKVTKIRQDWKEGELTKDEERAYVANFTVVDATDTSYTVNWSYENNLGSTYNIPEELLEKFTKYKKTDIQYKTSEFGELLEILNWEEVGENMNSMFDDILESLGGNNKAKRKSIEQSMQPIKQIYSSKQGIEQLLLKELQYFHFPMGLEYDVTEPILYEELLPNMFGGKPIKANTKMYFENVDFEEYFCTLKQEMTLDPNDTREMLKQVFKKMKLNKKGMKKALKKAVFEIKDNNTYEYYYSPGIPHKIETIRETVMDIAKEKGRRIDKTVIELIYNE